MSSVTLVGSVRTCVGCRQRAEKSVLLRVVAGDQGTGRQVLPDPSRRAPGRGAHMHPTVSCLELAVRRRAFGRALRVGGIDTEALEQFVRSQQQVHAGPAQHSSTPTETDKKMEQRLMSTR